MPRLTADEAARIARDNGLGIPDAAALMQLTDSTEEAEGLAARFATNLDPEELARAVEAKR